MRYYHPPMRRAGMHHRRRVPVGFYRGSMGDATSGGIASAAAMIECLSRGGTWDQNTQSCDMNDNTTPPGTGIPPGVTQGCSAELPCPPGYGCQPSPMPGISICLPTSTTPGGIPNTTPPSVPPSVPPTQPPPGMPPETQPKKTIFGLPATAVYIGGAAIGLIALAAIMKKKR